MTTAEAIAQATWEYTPRTLASGTPGAPANQAEEIAKTVWEYSVRTLTGAVLTALALTAVRWFNNDNTEASATPAADENAVLTTQASPKIGRIQVNATGDPDAADFQLEVKQPTDSVWEPVATD